MKKIFISGPYSKGDVSKNVKNAMDITNELIERGFAPYCPHLTHFLHLNHNQPYETWLNLDICYLEICDALLRLDGDSAGADKEVEFANRNNIPVYYKLEDLINSGLKFSK